MTAYKTIRQIHSYVREINSNMVLIIKELKKMNENLDELTNLTKEVREKIW